MTEAQVYEQLAVIFREIFLRDDLDVGPALSAKDVPGWDSLKQIEILVATEEHFGVKFRTKEIDSLQNVGDLANLVLAKANGAA